MGCRQTASFLEWFWEHERSCIKSFYRNNKKQLILDVSLVGHYINNQAAMQAEFQAVQLDRPNADKEQNEELYAEEESDLIYFFKRLRLQILYESNKGYIRMKKRMLLKRLGYKRLSRQLLERISPYIQFYRLQLSVRGGLARSLDNVGMDEMITIRVG